MLTSTNIFFAVAILCISFLYENTDEHNNQERAPLPNPYFTRLFSSNTQSIYHLDQKQHQGSSEVDINPNPIQVVGKDSLLNSGALHRLVNFRQIQTWHIDSSIQL